MSGSQLSDHWAVQDQWLPVIACPCHPCWPSQSLEPLGSSHSRTSDYTADSHHLQFQRVLTLVFSSCRYWRNQYLGNNG